MTLLRSRTLSWSPAAILASKCRWKNCRAFSDESSKVVVAWANRSWSPPICWGVCPVRIEFSDDPNVTIETAQKYLRDQKLTTAGDNLVVISDVRARDALVDCVQLRTAK